MEIKEIVARVLEIDPEEINEEEALSNYKNWTSLKQIMIITAVEKSYGIKFQFKDVKKLRSIRDFKLLCEKE